LVTFAILLAYQAFKISGFTYDTRETFIRCLLRVVRTKREAAARCASKLLKGNSSPCSSFKS
jgi:hypothetical protein